MLDEGGQKTQGLELAPGAVVDQGVLGTGEAVPPIAVAATQPAQALVVAPDSSPGQTVSNTGQNDALHDSVALGDVLARDSLFANG